MTRRKKYRLLRWLEEELTGASVGFLILAWVIEAFAGTCWPFIAALMASAISCLVAFECGCAARKMRRKKR